MNHGKLIHVTSATRQRCLPSDAGMDADDEGLHAYAAEHYPVWRTLRAQARVAGWNDELLPGALGEDLTLQGLLEADAWVGDLLRFASGCTLVVCGPPLLDPAEAARRFGFAQAPAMLRQSGFCGLLLALREPGPLAAGDAFEVVPGERAVTVAELFRHGLGRPR